MILPLEKLPKWTILQNMDSVKEFKKITDAMGSPSEDDLQLVKRAYEKAMKAHKDQKRLTGEPYFNHVLFTAQKLAEVGMDAPTISAGFLHDTIEDDHLTEDEVRKEFGEEILFLIKGVTKLGKLRYRGLERHTESLRKLFIATAQDVRVLVIRLADRLHNVITLDGHPNQEKRRRIALETLEIFVPLADRLGMGQLKGELEDAAFLYAYPKEYKEVQDILKQKSKLNEKYIEKVRRSLQKNLAKENIKAIKIDHRIKRIYSLYKKLLRYDMDIDKIYDIVALRVIVGNVAECYRVLGIAHNIWRPLPGRIKDYIAIPKQNGYQSIHTTIFTGDGGIVEIQIRTQEMHDEAEYGVASHLSYKEIGKGQGHKQHKMYEQKFPWVKQLLEWQKHFSESGEFLQNLKVDFFENRVFVFTPKGDVIDLPEGSGPIDFAYAIHTKIGNNISSAKINGKLSSLDTQLKNGDIVEIVTKKDAKPNEKWLKHVKSTLAKRQIRLATQGDGSKWRNFLQSKGPRHLF